MGHTVDITLQVFSFSFHGGSRAARVRAIEAPITSSSGSDYLLRRIDDEVGGDYCATLWAGATRGIGTETVIEHLLGLGWHAADMAVILIDDTERRLNITINHGVATLVEIPDYATPVEISTRELSPSPLAHRT